MLYFLVIDSNYFSLPFKMENSREILKTYKSLVNSSSAKLKPLKKNPLKNTKGNFRPNCLSVEDVYFGDSGKGSIVAKYNEILGKKNKKIVSLRYNGGGNAGHECLIDGKMVTTHQLPMGIVKENCTAVVSRGMLIHPEDLLTELDLVKKTLGGVPGELLIDERVNLGLDTHRALEAALNFKTTGGRGSTGRGIATGYAAHYLRIPVTLKDLLSSNWEERFKAHYQLFKTLVSAFGKDFEFAKLEVTSYGKEKGLKRKVGSEKEFLERLSSVRSRMRKMTTSSMYSILKEAWDNPSISFTLEGAQGAGIDPYHGVYPDVTASRPMSRNINDATYNIVLPENIPLRVAVMKTTYMSSVGRRVLPTLKDTKTEKWIQEAFDEKGRSTGRLRDIYPISIPIAHYLRIAAGYTHIAATHVDASKPDVPIKVITHYTHKKTGEELPYLPYQDHLDTLVANVVEFDGWDGEKTKGIKTPSRLPSQAKDYLSFISETIAPIAIATTGPGLDDFIQWFTE